MKLIDYFIIMLLLAIVTMAIVAIVQRKKNGGCSCGCNGCSKCDKNSTEE